MPRIPSSKPATKTSPPASSGSASNPATAVDPGGEPAQPTYTPAGPLPTIPISTKEEDIAFAPLLDDEQKAALAKVDGATRTKLRDLSRTLCSLRLQGSDLKKRKDKITGEWMGLFTNAGLGGVPCVNPVTREPLIAYRRSDEMLYVDPTDLREFLFEYFKVTKGEDDELATTHMLDIMSQVLKPEAINNDAFRKLVENGVIDGQVAAAASVISHKEPYVDFVKAGHPTKK